MPDDSVYAGKDGNVYKRDENGSWSKYDDGDWTPVDKPDRDDGNLKGREGTQSQERMADAQQRAQNAGISKESVTQAREGRQMTTSRSGQTAAQSPGQTQRRASVPSETMQQLDRDAFSRRQGISREQMRSRSFSGAGFGRRR